MDWTKDKVFEFIESLQTEPCLWDPQDEGYKNRGTQNDAWRRIIRSLSFLSTIDDLKKKKESLMGYYRTHLNNYKKSMSTKGEVYTTTWFAFELMDSFLRVVYEGNSAINTLNTSSGTLKLEASEGQEKKSNGSNPKASTSHEQNDSRKGLTQSKQPTQKVVKRQLPHEIIAQEKDEAIECIKYVSRKNERKDYDEYDHFGLMIGAKIRKICDSYERESLMNSIHNLIFESVKKTLTTSSCGSLNSDT